MLKDPECLARYEQSLAATTADALDSLPTEPSRENVLALQAHLATLPQLDLPPKHHFAPGMYGRELFIPADSVVVGKIHRHQHITILMAGECTINTNNGMERIVGPHVWISQVDAKRALYTHSDCVFFTCHTNANDETDLDKLEFEIIEPENIVLTYESEGE